MSRRQNSKDEVIDVTKGMLDRQNMALAMDRGTLQAEREVELQRTAEQAEREKLIAQSYEMAGQIKAVKMISKFGDVTSLMWLKQVKESKIYRDLPNIGTWEKYCEYLGLSRYMVDQDLANLSTFGEDFLVTVTNLQVGYRDLRKLRQLTHNGTVILEDDTITIGDKTIPVDKDHADDIQDAIEWILTENQEISKRVEKLEKEFNSAVKEETKGLQTEKKALLERVKTLEQYEPSAHDETWCEDQMQAIREQNTATCALISGFIVDPRLAGDRAAQAAVLEQLSKAEMMLRDLRARFETAYSIGD